MRIIPVIDLLNGSVVHAVKGERKRYQPVKSVLCDTPETMAIARAFREQLGLNEVYIADLNAIEGSDRSVHAEMIAALAEAGEMKIMLDAGVADAESASAWLDCGIGQIIVASETLGTWNDLRTFPSEIDPDRLIFSLDLRAGKILSRCPVLSAMPPVGALKWLQTTGWQKVILLDLMRVGSGQGIDRILAAAARANCPGLDILVGGGIAGPEDLWELRSLGIAGALAASALHSGAITAQHLSALSPKPA